MAKTSLTFVTFCQNRGESASRPGLATSNIQLNAVRPAHLKEKEDIDPNAALFTDGNGNLAVSVNGVTEDVAAVFKGGKKYEVVITEIEEVVP